MKEHIPTQKQHSSNVEAGNLLAENDIQYISPADQDPEGMPQHKFELTVDGEAVGGAEIDYFSKPLPMYYLAELWVEPEHAGQGNASRIMDKVEAFLKERRKPGVLTEAILDGPAQGMYERRGWVRVPRGLGQHVYNWPEHVSLDVLKGLAMRSTPIDEREGWHAVAEESSHDMDSISYSEDEESK